jgi:hypothetical protein
MEALLRITFYPLVESIQSLSFLRSRKLAAGIGHGIVWTFMLSAHLSSGFRRGCMGMGFLLLYRGDPFPEAL